MRTATRWSMIMILMISVGGAGVSPAVDIECYQNGEIITVKGTKVREGQWIFNEGQAKTIALATLNWAPYIDENICGQGWVQQLVVGAFIKLGYTVEISFYPWKRAVMTVERGRADVLFPEYFIPESSMSEIVEGAKRSELLALSDKFEGGPVAFWRKKDSDVQFNGDLKSLKGVSIGVVAGYENTPEFDQLKNQDYFEISEADSDWTNIKKLYHNRIKLIVGDPEVLQFNVIKHISPQEAEQYLAALETVTPVLADNHLYLTFSKNRPNYLEHLQAFNRVLAEMKATGKIAQIKAKYSRLSYLGEDCQSASTGLQ